MQASFKRKLSDIIDNRDYMDTIIVMLENPQSLNPIGEWVLLLNDQCTYFYITSLQDLCDIEEELETKLGVFQVHINGEVLMLLAAGCTLDYQPHIHWSPPPLHPSIPPSLHPSTCTHTLAHTLRARHMT